MILTARKVGLILLVFSLLLPIVGVAGQLEEPLSNSVKALMQDSIRDQAAPRLVFKDPKEGRVWLAEMSRRLKRYIPDEEYREGFLTTVHYEASRAGLDPQIVLSVIHVESAFRKYAISSAKARGFMQVMPFWVNLIGAKDHNLFDMRLNLRYGCTILRHYLDLEKGDLFRALGRYNGSLGKATYPDLVFSKHTRYWSY